MKLPCGTEAPSHVTRPSHCQRSTLSHLPSWTVDQAYTKYRTAAGCDAPCGNHKGPAIPVWYLQYPRTHLTAALPIQSATQSTQPKMFHAFFSRGFQWIRSMLVMADWNGFGRSHLTGRAWKWGMAAISSSSTCFRDFHWLRLCRPSVAKLGACRPIGSPVSTNIKAHGHRSDCQSAPDSALIIV